MPLGPEEVSSDGVKQLLSGTTLGGKCKQLEWNHENQTKKRDFWYKFVIKRFSYCFDSSNSIESLKYMITEFSPQVKVLTVKEIKLNFFVSLCF